MMNSPNVPSTPSATPSPATMTTSNTPSAVSAPSTNARGANRRPPKLRSSCDACGAAKVRCDKTQPRCGRCAAGGITCVYGLSRKFGKAPRKKAPAETGISENPASKAVAQNTHQSSLQCFPDYRSLSGGTARAVKYEPRSATSPSFGLEDSLMAFTSHGGHDMFMPSPDSMDSFNDPFSFSDAPHGHNAILRAGPRHHGTVDPLDLTFSAPDYSTFSEWIQHDDLMHTPESQPASDADSGAHITAHRLPTSFSSASLEPFAPSEGVTTPAAAASSSSSSSSTSLLQADSHHCQKLAYATLDSLSVRQDGAEQHHLTQTMDKVLNRNKQAVDNMRQLLACPCSRSPHLAMLYASITSKILMWYQLAAGCAKPAATTTTATWDSFPPLDGCSSGGIGRGGVGSGATGHHTSPHDVHHHHHHNQPTPPLSASSSPAATSATPAASPVAAQAQAQQHKGFVVTPMQFSVGAFSVDDEAAQEALRTQLLLSELRKAGHLIDLLCMQGGRPGEPAAAAAACGAAPGGEVNDIYSALGTWLKCELNRTVGSLQS
ncbi:hypothetical protein KVR01_012685 [Diaporthe batatas]|uniref:uncharacterized protein n=1 Tax=Diaporthe batatas TaxID=748121 RepID=UPI001D04CC86|nr:uncharacterized protein KVR01_012685 [Diaporthe batatas]KAG8157643.1 hypothetical protein KVR01_012685 [Diaporthe batatas]